MNKMHLEHLFLLTATFVILDLVSTFIGVRVGLIEAGILFKDLPFIYIIIVKIIFLFVMCVLYLSMLGRTKEATLNKMIYFVGGLNGGIFIANITQIYYYVSYYG